MTYEAESEKLKKALISCKVPDIGKAVDEAHAAGMPATEIINVLGAPCPMWESSSRGASCSCPTS